MKYVTMERIRGLNGEVLEAGMPISINDMPRLGYARAQVAWNAILELGDVVPVASNTPVRAAPTAAVSAPASARLATDATGPLSRRAGETDSGWAGRLAAHMRSGRPEAPDPDGCWKIGPPTAGWRAPTPEDELALALATSAAVDVPKAARDAALRARAAAPEPRPGPPPARDPSRPWVRP